MDKLQKQIILNEIRTWRENRLLPTEYCDFLSNLYSEGETAQQNMIHRERPKKGFHEIPWKLLLFSLVVSALVLLFVLHFTWFPNWMQMVVVLFLLLFFYTMAFGSFRFNMMLRPLFMGAGCLSVALLGYMIADALGLLDSVTWSLLIFVLVLAIWTLTGVAGKSRLLVAVSWIGIGVLYELALMYMKGVPWTSYGINLAYWAIFALTSFGVGLILGRKRVFPASVWMAAGVFSLMMPDVLILLSGTMPSFLIDVSAFLKLALLMTVGIVYRMEIQNWLDNLHKGKI